MRRRARWLLVCAALGAAAAVAGAGGPPRVVSDDLGHRLQVPAPPLRIVSLTPGATEMLFSAGAGAQVLATVEYSDEPPVA
ncbi:MAG TPA: hypothetical protein VFO23_10590, partial [Steroidobacteraceae bacterium]|nr:hypothetical protein [Steroidobacteraceae bacterium]